MSKFTSSGVRCPYYKDESKNSIRCEGIVSCSVVNNFSVSGDKKAYMQKFCRQDSFASCIIYKAVNEKYF